MDWTTIRVLTSNLGQYLDQYERGEHREMKSTIGQEHEGVTDEWWVGIRGLTSSLANELHLNMKELTEPGGFTAYLLSDREAGKSSSYMRQVTALVALARKLLADMDAATSAARPVSAATAAP